MDVIEYAKDYVQKSIEALGFDNKVNPSLNEGIINLKIDFEKLFIIRGYSYIPFFN